MGSRELFSAWSRLLERLFPDAFTLALVLTLVAGGAAIVLTPYSGFQVLGFWAGGFWEFLTFAMQMVLILVTGQALALAPSVARLIDRLVEVPKSQKVGVVLVCLGAMVGGWLNWGFGLVVGAILARKVSDRLGALLGEDHINRGLIGAAGYTGMAFWHGGLSGSAPLTVATPGHFLDHMVGVLPLSETVFSVDNFSFTLLMLVAVPAFLWYLAGVIPIGTPLAETSAERAKSEEAHGPITPGQRLLAYTVAAVAAVWWFGFREGLGLDSLNFFFLFLGLLLHGSPVRYAKALDQGMSGVSGIILQFPFYAGIVGLSSGSGLIGQISEIFVDLSRWSQESLGFQPFLIFVFLSAGLVNLFVPSGGGQWMIQGPIVLQAAEQLAIPGSEAVMAVAYGDQWTNLLQPFWALPLLAITGLKPAQLLSVSSLLLLWMGALTCLALMFF